MAFRLARAARIFPAKSLSKGWNSVISRNFAAVGDKLPSVELHHGFPPKKYNLADFAKDKSILLVGLPGAFTPVRTCEILKVENWKFCIHFSYRKTHVTMFVRFSSFLLDLVRC